VNTRFLSLAAMLLACLCACEAPSTAPAVATRDEMDRAPAVAHMLPAQASGKIGVPVDVRYLVAEQVTNTGARSIELAFIPRVAGTNMQIEFPTTEGVSIESGSEPVMVQKPTASDVFRRRLSVNTFKATGAAVRALVSMDVDGGRYFSVFVIPLDEAVRAKDAGTDVVHR
jgi:hypothetical protein